MIIPKKRICDICKIELGRGDRVIKIKSSIVNEGSGGIITIRRDYDMCEMCLCRFRMWFGDQLRKEEKANENNV